MHASKLLLCAAVGAGLSGCSPSPMSDGYWAPARPLGNTYESYQPSIASDRGDDHPAVDPEGDLSLRDALAVALLGNPELAAWGFGVRAAGARTLQAGLWPNPALGVELENFAGSGGVSGTDSLETTLVLSQAFPLGGDVERRRRLAALRGELAGWDYEAARITLMTEVTQRFVEALAAQRQVSLAEQSLALARQVFDSIRRRIEAGDAPDIERSRAAVPVATAAIELKRAEHALEAARARLALMWGASSPRFTRVVGDLDQVRPAPPAAALVALVNQNPQVARWAVEITARQAQVKLAQAQAVPDLTASLGYRRLNESDDSALVAGISIPLPLFDRGQGDILAARIDVASARRERRAAELRVEAALAAVYGRLRSAHAEAIALRDDALPPAGEAYEAIRGAFEQGNLGFLDVLDAERTLIDLRRQHLAALAAYHSAAAEVEGLIGQPLAEVGRQEPSQPLEDTNP